MLVDREYLVTIYSRNLKRYREKGYEFKGKGDKIWVKAQDLSHASKTIQIEFICDYCGKHVWVTPYVYFHHVDGKDCCQECAPIKAADMHELNTGYRYDFLNPEKRRQFEESQIQKFGNKCFFQSEQGKLLRKKYCEEHGVANPFSLKENQEKQKQTCLEKYGVENVFSSEKVKAKIKQFWNDNYNVDFPMQVEEIKNRSLINRNISYDKNHDVIVSKPQKILHELYGGELNKLFTYYFVDIYFPENKIYLEYDGGWHKLSVILGGLTEEEFTQKETRRYKFLKQQGLKCFKIISSTDELPSEDILLQIKNYAFDFLSQVNNNWIYFDLTQNVIITKQGNINNIEQSIVTTSAGSPSNDEVKV